VSPFVLSVLKYALLALLYFFVFRAVRSVMSDLRSRNDPARATRPAASAPAAPRPSRGAKPPTQVAVFEGDGAKPRTVRLDDPTEIGRGDHCAIRLGAPYVSQVHARLSSDGGAWSVEDLGSTNGTFLNDRKVDGRLEVHAGDVVKVGKTVLELRR
jgi:pSer/pThr/pTyr-binding forkhead associated (FHA) protein